MLRVMRLASFGALTLVSACAPSVLQTRTMLYGSTFDQLEDRLVLDNISAFIDDKDKIPSHIDFKQGTVQATDNLSVGATVPYVPGRSGNSISVNPQVFNVSAVQIQSQDNWNYQPVTDVDDLVRVRCLYNFLILQSEPENWGKKYATYGEWVNFTQRHCLVSNQQTIFKYAPPLKPWLTWTPDENTPPDERFLDRKGNPLSYLGTFRSRALWGNLKDFHDFELSVLGSMPNTTGATGSAATSKPPAPPPGPTPGMTLSVTPNPKIFSAAEQNIAYQYVVANTGGVPIAGIKVVDTIVRDIKCPTQALPAQRSTVCSGNYTTTARDVEATNVSNGAFVNGTTPAGPINAQDSATIYLEGHVPLTTLEKLEAVRPRVAKPPSALGPPQIQYPPYSPGKSSAPIIPPPAAPAQ